ncbi:NAD-dependent epimerase/dehydratase family protein [Rothia nasimurium]|uniref:NAD-dependent epimerase/dehydratase family protein n=1 Tax=Rothia nasimurium TaxID=85336 RepID=A0A4Y9F5K1_9MICC|nr:NAD(P)H-binding protein [Rothia nasimurium]MBF0807433.1 NAD(P)H-binding protein [Rothia nasimurium]TFU23732.1 NAD-dependent epimerase/dehydratase family protein [Rothia nasimurium]
MNISVIGAAGMVGSAIVAEAQNRGHQVTSYTRSGSAGTLALDLANTNALVDVINSSEATVISVASRDDYSAAIAAHRSLIAAAPIGRFLIVGGAGALQAGDIQLFETPDFPEEYLTEAKTFAAVLDDYRAASDLNWTMLAPSPMIAPGARTGDYRTKLDVPAGMFVSTQDFAVAAIDELEKPAHQGARFTVASADEAAAQGQ